MFSCDANEDCNNTIGSYNCICKKGYMRINNVCTDVDECQMSIPVCNVNAYCNNTMGGYNCTCIDGYRGNGTFCQDINECKYNLSNCHDDANCKNFMGSYNCSCKDGFDGDGKFCEDIDECKANISDCHGMAYCTNTISSFNCTCRDGFTGSGTYCEDIDECKRKTASCPENAFCNNTIGSYECVCGKGYLQNGSYCQDINECEMDKCHEYAFCNNTDGGFNCTCLDDYWGDGIHCEFSNITIVSPCSATCGGVEIILNNGKRETRNCTTGCFLQDCPSPAPIFRSNQVKSTMTCKDVGPKEGEVVAGKSVEGPYYDKDNCIKFCEEVSDFNAVAYNAISTIPNGNKTDCKCLWKAVSFATDCKSLDAETCMTCYLPQPPIFRSKQVKSTCKDVGPKNLGKFADGYLREGHYDKDDCMNFCVDYINKFRVAIHAFLISSTGNKSSCICLVDAVSFATDCKELDEETCTTCYLEPSSTDKHYLLYNLDNNDENPLVLGIMKRWKVTQSQSPTTETGPTGDHTFPSGCGKFIYFESSPLNLDDPGYFGTPPLTPVDTSYCLQFFLHMYAGIHEHEMGSLEVYLYNEDVQNLTYLFSHEGITTKNADQWTEIKVSIELPDATSKFGVLFKGIRGEGHHSDIAIDDILLTDGSCDGSVNGNWGPWSNYGSCSGGKRIKMRECNSPPPYTNQTTCIGDKEASIPCYEQSDMLSMVVGVWHMYRDPKYTYNITSDGELLGDPRGTFVIGQSDNQKNFPTNDYWLKAQSESDSNETIYFRLNGDGGMIFNLFGPSYMKTYGELSNYYGQPGYGRKVTDEWAEWGRWFACSISCRSGSRYRFRECMGKGTCRNTNGTLSIEEKQETECDETTCRSDGVITAWGEWSKCSKSCNFGVSTRIGICSVIDGCNGNITQTKPCGGELCPGHQAYSSWSLWSLCSATCGHATQIRQKTCLVPDMCIGNSTEKRDCQSTCHIGSCGEERIGRDIYNFENGRRVLLGTKKRWTIAKKTPSPSTGPDQDTTFSTGCGHFIYYEASGHKPGDTGFISIQKRHPRWSTNCLRFSLSMYSAMLSKSNMGALDVYFYDDATSMKNIFKQEGVIDDQVWKPIEVQIDVTKGKSYWIVFKATRGLGYHSDIALDDIILSDGHCKEYSCDSFVDMALYTHTPSNLMHAVPDEKYFLSSLIDNFDMQEGVARASMLTADMSSPMSNANLSNINGIKPMIENIDVKMMQGSIAFSSIMAAFLRSFELNGRKDTPKIAFLLTDTENIYVEQDVESYLNAHRGDIKFVAIGVGQQVNKTLLNDYADGKAFFVSTFEELRDAEFIRRVIKEACPVPIWSSWSNSSECDAACGGGKQYKERNCSLNYPNKCVGDRIMWENCNENPCPVDGKWSDWRPWSQCDKTCRGGSKHRSRECSNPFPAYGGDDCEKIDGSRGKEETQYTSCGGIETCDYIGGWSKWTHTPCSVSCGLGHRYRSRKCNNPPPSGPGGCLVNVDLGGIKITVQRMFQNESEECGSVPPYCMVDTLNNDPCCVDCPTACSNSSSVYAPQGTTDNEIKMCYQFENCDIAEFGGYMNSDSGDDIDRETIDFEQCRTKCHGKYIKDASWNTFEYGFYGQECSCVQGGEKYRNARDVGKYTFIT